MDVAAVVADGVDGDGGWLMFGIKVRAVAAGWMSQGVILVHQDLV